MRNQIIVHTAGGSETVKYMAQSTTRNRLDPGSGTLIGYADQVTGYNEFKCSALDQSTGNWGGIDLLHLVKAGETEVGVRLRVGTNGDRQLMNLFWENANGQVWHGTTNAVSGSNIVQCLASFNSIFISQELGAEFCITADFLVGQIGSCGSAARQYGTYFNTCTIGYTNSIYTTQGQEYWSVEVGKANINRNYGDGVAREEYIGEVLLLLQA